MSGFEKPDEQIDWGAVNVQVLRTGYGLLRIERAALRRELDEVRGERDRARNLAVLLEAECARVEDKNTMMAFKVATAMDRVITLVARITGLKPEKLHEYADRVLDELEGVS